jgi:hypothetical protein
MSAEDRRLREAELLLGELRDHLSLEGIDEADAEDVVADLGDLGIGRGGRDHRDARLLADRSGRHASARSHLAQDRDHAVLVDELVHGRRGFLGLRLIVLDDHLHLGAADPARGVQVVQVELDPILRGDPERGRGACERSVLADHDLVALLGAACHGRDRGHEQGGERQGSKGPDHAPSSMT